MWVLYYRPVGFGPCNSRDGLLFSGLELILDKAAYFLAPEKLVIKRVIVTKVELSWCSKVA